MNFDKSTIAVSSEYFTKIMFSVPVLSFVYKVKRIGEKTYRFPDNNTPLNRTNYFLWHNKFVIQMSNYRPNKLFAN